MFNSAMIIPVLAVALAGAQFAPDVPQQHPPSQHPPPIIRANETLPEGDPRPRTYYYTPEQEERVKSEIICRGVQCIPFLVVADHSQHVQERTYSNLDLVTSTPEIAAGSCSNFSHTARQGYYALVRYRHGNNSDHRPLRHSTPVVIEVTNTPGSSCPTKQKVWYYVPRRIAAEGNGLPKPVEANLNIEKLNNIDVYVRTFTGKGDRPEPEVDILRQQLGSLRLCAKNDRHFVALYDPPSRKKGRRNEVWLEKTSC